MTPPSHAPPREKDRWDKANIVGQVLVPIMLAALTGAYSILESSQKRADAQAAAALQVEAANTAKANAVAAFLPYVRGDADSTQIQIVAAALSSLGYESFALEFATRGSTAASVQALGALATTADRTAIRDSAVAVLARISNPSPTTLDSAAGGLATVADVVLARLQGSESASPGGESAIVTGGYGDVREAQAFAASTARPQLVSGVYRRNNVVRTAIRFATRAQARTALPGVRATARRTAYIVDWKKWCPDPKEGNGLVECGVSDPESVVR